MNRKRVLSPFHVAHPPNRFYERFRLHVADCATNLNDHHICIFRFAEFLDSLGNRAHQMRHHLNRLPQKLRP